MAVVSVFMSFSAVYGFCLSFYVCRYIGLYYYIRCLCCCNWLFGAASYCSLLCCEILYVNCVDVSFGVIYVICRVMGVFNLFLFLMFA